MRSATENLAEPDSGKKIGLLGEEQARRNPRKIRLLKSEAESLEGKEPQASSQEQGQHGRLRRRHEIAANR